MMRTESHDVVPDDDGSICSGWGSDVSLSSEEFREATGDDKGKSSLEWEMEDLRAKLHAVTRTLEAQKVEHDALRRKVSLMEASQRISPIYYETAAKLVTVLLVGIIQVVLPYILLTSRRWFLDHEETWLPLFGSANSCTVLVFLILRICLFLLWKSIIGEERNLIRDPGLPSLVLLSAVPLSPRMAMITFSTIRMGLTIGIIALDSIGELERSEKKGVKCSSDSAVSDSTLIRWICLYKSYEERIVQKSSTVDKFLVILYMSRAQSLNAYEWLELAAVCYARARAQRSGGLSSLQRFVQYGICVAIVLSLYWEPLGLLLLRVFLAATGVHELFLRLSLWARRQSLEWKEVQQDEQVREETHAPRPNRELRHKKIQ